MRFWLVCLSTPTVRTLSLKDQQMGKWDNLFGTSDDCSVLWNKLPMCWRLKDKKNSLVIINNYLLKHNGVKTIAYIYIYIYIYMKIALLFCCIWEVDKWGIWRVQSFYVTRFFEEWGFCWRGFSSWRDFFSYSPVFSMDIGYLLSSNLKTIYFFLLRIPLGTNIPDWRTNHRSFDILLFLFSHPVSWCCRIIRQHFCRGVRSSIKRPRIGSRWRPVMLKDGIQLIEQWSSNLQHTTLTFTGLDERFE